MNPVTLGGCSLRPCNKCRAAISNERTLCDECSETARAQNIEQHGATDNEPNTEPAIELPEARTHWAIRLLLSGGANVLTGLPAILVFAIAGYFMGGSEVALVFGGFVFAIYFVFGGIADFLSGC